DPIADLAGLGLAYYRLAITNPHLYRAMYMEQPLDAADAAAGSEAFDILVAAMRRCFESGRFVAGDARELATQFWAVGHGAITLQMAQLLSPEEALKCLRGAVLNLFIAYGDDLAAARRSLTRAGRRASRLDLQAVEP